MTKRTIAKYIMLIIIILPALQQFYQNHFQTEDAAESSQSQEDFVYTKHAKCRMNCRNISRSEVEHVLANGRLNQKKSKPNDQPCPSYAYEAKNSKQEDLRVVVAYCEDATKLVTVINLDRKFDCSC